MQSKSVIESVSSVLGSFNGLNVLFDPPADGPRSGTCVPISDSSLHPNLHGLIASEAPDGLFTHQQQAIESVLAGNHTIAAEDGGVDEHLC